MKPIIFTIKVPKSYKFSPFFIGGVVVLVIASQYSELAALLIVFLIFLGLFIVNILPERANFGRLIIQEKTLTIEFPETETETFNLADIHWQKIEIQDFKGKVETASFILHPLAPYSKGFNNSLEFTVNGKEYKLNMYISSFNKLKKVDKFFAKFTNANQ